MAAENIPMKPASGLKARVAYSTYEITNDLGAVVAELDSLNAARNCASRLYAAGHAKWTVIDRVDYLCARNADGDRIKVRFAV